MFKQVKRYFMIILLLSLIVPLYSFSGGNGSSVNPYQVESCDDLQNISNYLDSHFLQIKDIDCGVGSHIVGNGFDPIGPIFTGLYDGDSYLISNLFINRPGDSTIGLFARSTGSVSNVGLIEFDVSSMNYVAGLIGYNSGLVNFSFSRGNVSGTSMVGNLVAGNYGGTIENSYSSGRVNGISFVGGLAGFNDGIINNSFSFANVIGSTDVGGFVGKSISGVIQNSFSVGNVSGTSDVGGFIGEHVGDSILNSYWSNHSGNVELSVETGTTTGISPINNNNNWFYTSTNEPMNSWNNSYWIYSGSDYPIINFNSDSTPAPSNSASVVSFPSFGISSVLVVLFGIVVFLFI